MLTTVLPVNTGEDEGSVEGCIPIYTLELLLDLNSVPETWLASITRNAFQQQILVSLWLLLEKVKLVTSIQVLATSRLELMRLPLKSVENFD